MNEQSSDERPEGHTTSTLRWRALLGALALVVLLVVGVVLAKTGELERLATVTTAWVRGAGALGVLAFSAIYVVCVVAVLPTFPLTMGAGALWGAGRATLLVVPVATLGCTLAFMCGRYLFRELVEVRVQRVARFEALDRALGERGFWLVLLLRFSPVLPYNVLNYSLGVTRVRLGPYVFGSALGMILVTFMWAQLGATAGSLAAAEGAPASVETQIVRVVSLVATIAVVLLITRRARRALQDSVESGDSSNI